MGYSGVAARQDIEYLCRISNSRKGLDRSALLADAVMLMVY